MKTRYFGEIEIPDDSLAIMDGGIHGVQGHTIRIATDASGNWERRLDGFAPQGVEGSGSFRVSDAERAWLNEDRERLWELAAGKPAGYFPSIEHGPPRWVWAIVMRSNGETRLLEGGAIARPQGAPDDARRLLDWLVERVDGLANHPG